MENLPELKPCPFCGGAVDATNVCEDDGLWFVECGNCLARTQMCYMGENAYILWNVRADTVKHGHYIINDDGDSRCSVCGENYLDCTQNYCPNCGACLD